MLAIDRNNYHLFEPQLYQVACAGPDPREAQRRG
jgi:NADH dehydrogenase FAD-containing subunit